MNQEKKDALIEKFEKYDEAMHRYCQRKVVNHDNFNEIMTNITLYLKTIDEQVQGMRELSV